MHRDAYRIVLKAEIHNPSMHSLLNISVHIHVGVVFATTEVRHHGRKFGFHNIYFSVINPRFIPIPNPNPNVNPGGLVITTGMP